MPNQIKNQSRVSPDSQLHEKIQTWVKAMSDDKRYCHYIAVGLTDSGIASLLGNWNIPFYSLEEANQFKNTVQSKHPDRSFCFITGVLHVELAMKDNPNTFWDNWQKKHKERIELLNNKEG